MTISLNSLPQAPTLDSSADLRPPTIVVQPNDDLNQFTGHSFRQMLEEALEQAQTTVIVDFLWVSSLDSDAIKVLVLAMEKAVALGKMLSFHSLESSLRSAVDAEWVRRQELLYGSWNSVFQHDLEIFLNQLPHAQDGLASAS